MKGCCHVINNKLRQQENERRNLEIMNEARRKGHSWHFFYQEGPH